MGITFLCMSAILAIFVSSVTSEGCTYQFHVPETSGVKCDGETTRQLQHTMDHLQAELFTSSQRQVAMSETFSRELLKLDMDAKGMKNMSTIFEVDLQQMQTTISSLAPLVDEVKGLRDIITNSKLSLEPKFSDLQSKMMTIISTFQNESVKLSDQVQAAMKSQADQLALHAQTIADLSRTSTELKEQTQGQAEMLANLTERLQAAEKKVNTDPSIADQLHSLKGAVNLLQNASITGYRRNREQIRKLQAQLAAKNNE